MINKDFLEAISRSLFIISAIRSSNDFEGSQPKLFLAFEESPNKESTSEGLKYLLSTFITISLLSFLLPTSSNFLPSQAIPPQPSSIALSSINFLTLSCLPVAIT